MLQFLGKDVLNSEKFSVELLDNWTEIYNKYSGTSFEAKNGDTLHYYKEPNYLGEEGDIFRLAFIHLANGELIQLGVVEKPYKLIDSEVFTEAHKNAITTIKAENPPVDVPKEESPKEDLPTADEPTKEPEETENPNNTIAADEVKDEKKPEEDKIEDGTGTDTETDAKLDEAYQPIDEVDWNSIPNDEPNKKEEKKPEEEPKLVLNEVPVTNLENDWVYIWTKELEGKAYSHNVAGTIRIYELLKAIANGEITIEVFFHELASGVLSKQELRKAEASIDFFALRQEVNALINKYLVDLETPKEAAPTDETAQ